MTILLIISIQAVILFKNLFRFIIYLEDSPRAATSIKEKYKYITVLLA